MDLAGYPSGRSTAGSTHAAASPISQPTLQRSGGSIDAWMPTDPLHLGARKETLLAADGGSRPRTGSEVTVVMPTHNRAQLMQTTLRAVLRQRDVDLRVIVVDDGSSDETPEVLGAIRDPRVRWHRH